MPKLVIKMVVPSAQEAAHPHQHDRRYDSQYEIDRRSQEQSVTQTAGGQCPGNDEKHYQHSHHDTGSLDELLLPP